MRGGGGLPPQVVVPSQSRSSSSDSGTIISAPQHVRDWGGHNSLTAKLVVTAITGSVTVAIEHSDTGAGGWTTVDTFPVQSSTTTGIVRTIPSTSTTKGFVRVSWVIVTGPVTFSVAFSANPGQMT